MVAFFVYFFFFAINHAILVNFYLSFSFFYREIKIKKKNLKENQRLFIYTRTIKNFTWNFGKCNNDFYLRLKCRPEFQMPE